MESFLILARAEHGGTVHLSTVALDELAATVLADLSVKEFGVLEALLRAAPAFLSTEELLEQVWDENADPFTNTVFNTLSRLRRKLGNPSPIETRPGVGYRITDPGGQPLA